jgi:hypothetical protein
MSRLYGKIFRDLVEEENEDEEEQSGFRTGRSCTDIFCMKKVIEKKECNKPRNSFIVVDLTITYDSVFLPIALRPF